MAERRMFSKTLIDSDLFLDMPLSTQALYFHLSMRADDEGFVNNPKKIIRMIGADEDSLRILIAKQFILPFDSGIVVIKHWRIHNYIQKDRFKETVYTEERAQLVSNKNGEYTKLDTACIQSVSNMDTSWNHNGTIMDTQDSIGKVSIGKDSIEYRGDKLPDNVPDIVSPAPSKQKRFIKPSIEQIEEYCRERNNSVNPQKFYDYYESNGWRIGGKAPMKDWKAAVRTWESNNYGSGSKPGTHSSGNIDKYKEFINDF